MRVDSLGFFGQAARLVRLGHGWYPTQRATLLKQGGRRIQIAKRESRRPPLEENTPGKQWGHEQQLGRMSISTIFPSLSIE